MMRDLRLTLAARIEALTSLPCLLDPSRVGGSMGADGIAILLGQPDVEPATLADWWVSTPVQVLLRPDASPEAWDTAWDVWTALVCSPDLPVAECRHESVTLGRRDWLALVITIRQPAGIGA